LVDLADERVDRVHDVFAGQRHLGALEYRTRRVERVGRDPEHDARGIRLRRLLEEAKQTRDTAETDEQHTGGIGIERARMADAALPVDIAKLSDDVVARPPARLVDDDEPVSHGRPTYCLQESGRLATNRLQTGLERGEDLRDDGFRRLVAREA